MRIPVLFFSIPFMVTGCASIVGGSSQSLSVNAIDGAHQISGATCTLVNNKGTWYVTTPGSVTVHRAHGDLTVDCKKDGLEPGSLVVKSSTKGMAYGNIIFGGIIGGAVDMGTGAAYRYPSLITVLMGKSAMLATPAVQDQSKEQGRDN